MIDRIDQNGASVWPAGHRAALCPVLRLIGPLVVDRSDGRLFGTAPYGATGLISVLRLLEDLDLRATIAPDEDAAQAYAPTLRRCHLGGHELAVAVTNGDASSAERAMESLRHITGTAPRGIVVGAETDADSTALRWPEWQLATAGTDMPTLLDRGSETSPLVTLPGSPYWVDATWLHPDRPLPPSSLLEAWTLAIDAVRTAGGLMTIVVHPHLIARPGLQGTLGRFLDEAIGSGDVWIAPGSDIAGWWIERHLHK